MCGAELRYSFCDVLGSLSCFARCLACTLRCRSRCRSGILTGFGGSIFFLDCPFLLPTGKGIGTGIGVVLFELLIQGIATMQIQNLNALVDTVRHEIIERYRPGEDDPHLKVLQAAHISDDEYFSHMVLDDLNLIIRDIREAHKKDSESAPQTTVADELKENLEAVENFKGSRDEKLVVLYCKQLGINYKNLSDEEFRWLIRILKKSKKMGTPISQRKKR